MSTTGKKTLTSGMALHDNKSRFLLGDVFNTTPPQQSQTLGLLIITNEY